MKQCIVNNSVPGGRVGTRHCSDTVNQFLEADKNPALLPSQSHGLFLSSETVTSNLLSLSRCRL